MKIEKLLLFILFSPLLVLALALVACLLCLSLASFLLGLAADAFLALAEGVFWLCDTVLGGLLKGLAGLRVLVGLPVSGKLTKLQDELLSLQK